MNSVRDYLPSQRLFEVHWDALSDLELVTLLLSPGKSENQALADAQRLFERIGTLRRLKEISCRQLRLMGFGQKRALALLAAVQLSRRLQKVPLFNGQSFRCSAEIFRHFQPLCNGHKKECFWDVLLDGKNRILKVVRVSEGSLTSSLVHPREVFRSAIREAAAGIVFVHNHPSGDPVPSQEDLQITKRLAETGRTVGIRVLDHVIIGSHRYFSFADQGLL